MLNLNTLKEYISEKVDLITKYRPQVLYAPRPPARRKYQTAIRAPDKNFFNLMIERNAYLWIVVKKNLQGEILQKIQKSYECVKGTPSFRKIPICSKVQQAVYWVKLVQCQIVVFEDIFFETFQQLKKYDNACGFHVISQDNVQIAKLARQNRKIKNIYDSQTFILGVLKQNMQRLAISKQEKQIQSKIVCGQEFKRILIRNITFPNFIKLSKHDKSQHNQYRLHLIGLTKLTSDDKLASKDKFIELSRENFSKDSDLIDQYNSNEFQDPKQILRFYTLDSFFYKILNNTLRIAKNTEQFFSIGQPFNKVFDAIKIQYDKNQSLKKDKKQSVVKDSKIQKQNKDQTIIVYRGADLTASQCQYLQQNKNNYIQINGFISTSKKLQTAKNFAKQRKNKTIFQIKLSHVQQKYRQYDYGYVDLQLNKCSAFDQDQVLINALNVFKIIGKREDQQFDIFELEYGAIFSILDKDPMDLQESDRFAYYSFKQLKQMNEQVKDIGEVYLRTNQPEKAIEIYQFKLQKLNQGEKTLEDKQEIEKIKIQAADAYLANGQPDKALKYYESIFANKAQNNNYHNPPPVNSKQSIIVSSSNIQSKKQIQMLQIITKVTKTKNDMDNYENAQNTYQQTKSLINSTITESSIQTLWLQIQLEWEIVKGKQNQLRYQEAFKFLKEIQRLCNKGLKKLKNQYQPYQQKKLRLHLTQVYEAMAQLSQQLHTQKKIISDIKKSFDQVCEQLSYIIQKNSYEQGLINLRRSEILSRTKQIKQQILIKTYSDSIKLIQSNTNQNDQILPTAYNRYAQVQKKSSSKIDNTMAKNTFKKQLKLQTVLYGNQNPKPLKTKIDIGICQRQDKNTTEALEQFDQAFHTKLYKQQQKYSIHAKVLFNMGHAYSDKGDDGLALKSYNEAFNILKKRLTPRDFDRSILRYKITLKIGRLYMNSSLRSQPNLRLAQKHLNQYHIFITSYYNYKHSDVGLSYNCLGALYSTLKKYQISRQKYEKSIDIYEQCLGKNSLDVAKIKSNLAICYAWLKKQSKSTKVLLESQEIFNRIYGDLRKLNPFEFQIKYIKAEIETIFGEYQNAIKSCQESIELQKFYLLSKSQRRKIIEQIDGADEINQNQYQSYYLNAQMRGRQFNSVQINNTRNNQFNNSFQTQMPRTVSQDPNRLQKHRDITQHGFKCLFKICQCLMYLKRYQTAKDKIQKLQLNLNQRILDQKINPLFKDNLQSKKLVYLKKTDEYLEKVNKYLRNKAKKQNQPLAERKNTMHRELSPQNFDNFQN